jgi:LmbE family N-acetylglucosaminyl deacetylase
VVPDVLVDTPTLVPAIDVRPDDRDVVCGGTLERWAEEGAEARVLICTNGDKGITVSTGDPKLFAERGAREAREAAWIIGLPGQNLDGHLDREMLDDTDVQGELVTAVRRVCPEVVRCPDSTVVFFSENHSNHRDHRVVGSAALDAVSCPAALSHHFPEAGPAPQVETVSLLGTVKPTLWVDATWILESKLAAVACHASLFPDAGQWALRALSLRAEEDGCHVVAPSAEGFRRLRLGG